ncbi:hypothetical protein SAMN02910413_1137 [Pseudobutyrivibrio sp. C4]|uniref:hypothetical protein n=1 Tax=Pseudobutyrivibrio sp. C4 TaxID=1520803 RepID=UPI0008C2B45D|nr:hypothetical protein [Pseudobutyrivibrio sp. C4]SES89153.1 hypothetical protein SAMN02910413_1137 [Pseudobutyrivibrio sp. C4]
MFYEIQPQKNKDQYKRILKIIGQLSNLFSESDCPYLSYRAHENSFCKYLEADNLARYDCSADAKKDRVGVGLKTWMGRDDQKVAEFGRLRNTYAELNGIELIDKIAEYRNERIRVTMNMHGIDTMIYHVVKRIPGAMQILECSFDYIDRENISLIDERGNNNNTYFSDGVHTYHFSRSKNTLYMIFDDLEELDRIEVPIIDDPFELLMHLSDIVNSNNKDEHLSIAADETINTYSINVSTESSDNEDSQTNVNNIINVIENSNSDTLIEPQICLPLFAIKKGERYVPERSGLNQWNANGRARDCNEIYIPYLSEVRQAHPDFFPPRDTPFDLKLPDGTVISAKVCQAAFPKVSDEAMAKMSEEDRLKEEQRQLVGKSIMSNPNKVLGKWLLRDVFEVPEGTLITYEMLERFGVDSVVFTKHSSQKYSIDFAELGTYEKFYGMDSFSEEIDE